jgi:hypothetical protein
MEKENVHLRMKAIISIRLPIGERKVSLVGGVLVENLSP